MTIPVAQKNQIKSEIITCITNDGKEPEECLIAAQKQYGLSKKDTKDVANEIMEEAED